MNTIDLRSDTVSWPTPAMREAMANAPVGDDVYGEDPTINRLQKMAAERVNKEAALFVPSGTMGNLIAALVHCGRGDELILGNKSHTFLYEAGNTSALGSIHPHTLPNLPDGTIGLDEIRSAIRTENTHFPHSKAVFIENTHNMCGGVVIPPTYLAAVREIADQNGLKFHMDGARVFNASVALGCPVSELTQYVDSVTFCLSKGLCCPVGSLLCGSVDFIKQATRARKSLGGGMRQAGVLAAAGIVALEQMVDRLAVDHANARRLAEGLAALPGIQIDLDKVQTNLIFFGIDETVGIEPQELIKQLDSKNVKIGHRYGRLFRACTHYWIDQAKIDTALAAFKTILAGN